MVTEYSCCADQLIDIPVAGAGLDTDMPRTEASPHHEQRS